MKLNLQIHYRKSIRLKEYDYSTPGAYFITILAKNRENLFGEIKDGIVVLNELGRLVEKCWLETPKNFQNVELDVFVVMPNHFHGIIIITESVRVQDNVRAGLVPAQATPIIDKMATTRVAPTLGTIIGSFKSKAVIEYTKTAKENNLNVDTKIWHRNYYEHIIRNEKSFEKIREYIANNPFNWQKDEYFVY